MDGQPMIINKGGVTRGEALASCFAPQNIPHSDPGLKGLPQGGNVSHATRSPFIVKEETRIEKQMGRQADPCQVLTDAVNMLATKYTSNEFDGLKMAPYEIAVYSIPCAIEKFPVVQIAAKDEFGGLSFYIRNFYSNTIKIVVQNSTANSRDISIYVI